ncbi:hypothetical protein ASG88_08745 [Nocardioides sp. Soil777]|nr:hypothetical protein ASG88_08745 [Nocardioides sp. Soil777]
MRVVRIGTWNLAGRWSDHHGALLEEAACDVWLLTEVSERVALEGYRLHASQAPMTTRRDWAAVVSRQPPAASR